MSTLQLEIDKILELNSHEPDNISKYVIPSCINIPNLFESLINQVNNAPMQGNNKNYKMEYYYPILEFIVNEMNNIYFNIIPNATLIKSMDLLLRNELLGKLTILMKGQTLLNKLTHRITKVMPQQHMIMRMLMESARTGPFMTFLFWINKLNEKSIEKLPKSELEQVFIYSIGNSDDRLFKFVLEKILKVNKLFFQQNVAPIESMIGTLASSLVPPKYQLKRLKLLSSYISLVPYFKNMIEHFSSDKVIIELHKHYYVHPYSFDMLHKIFNIFIINDWSSDSGSFVINEVNYNKIVPLFKTEEEVYILNIIISISHDVHKLTKVKKAIFNKIIHDNYVVLIEMITWGSLNYNNEMLNHVISSLVEQNLINKYVNSRNVRNINQIILYYTRFIKIPSPIVNINQQYNSDVYAYNKAIKINKFLHKLRLYVKSKCKTRVIQHKVKMFDLLCEIKSFNPKSSVPVLKNGSVQYQFQKQKFTNLPPRHLLPGEISIYNNFLLKEKADGILINNLPIGIYPQIDIIKNYQVKAEYIEEFDLYLIFDIDIPNTTIEDRYNILRSYHPYTTNTKMQKINSLGDFIQLFNQERNIIKNFMIENQSESIKWYPKFACIYNSTNNSIHGELIQNIILEQDALINEIISNSELFKCDGLILTPLNGAREIKIKPKSMMTIDLLFDGKKWVDRNNNDWSSIIIKPKTNKKEGRIYRCHPTELFDKFTVGEFRYDKKKPNPYNIVNNIITMIQYDWSKDTQLSGSYYYDSVKKITSVQLINTINAQIENLSSQITLMEPEINKSWLDLGCGRGKLIQIIKKYNPKQYIGLDVDIKQLIKGLQYHDENQDVYVFAPCNLAGNWAETPIKWQQINKTIKYDYIVANFSLMHFCTDEFWSQLDDIVHSDTKFIFNVVSPPVGKDSWSESESYLRVEGNQTKYKFEWTHDEEKIEPFISEEQLTELIKRYNWKVIEKKNINSNHKLINFYKWWIIKKC